MSFFSSRRRHTRYWRDWSSDVCSSDLDNLVRRYLEEEERYPETVGIVVWGTAAMRTQGDDVAEVLALLGARLAWNEESRRAGRIGGGPHEALGGPRLEDRESTPVDSRHDHI